MHSRCTYAARNFYFLHLSGGRPLAISALSNSKRMLLRGAKGGLSFFTGGARVVLSADIFIPSSIPRGIYIIPALKNKKSAHKRDMDKKIYRKPISRRRRRLIESVRARVIRLPRRREGKGEILVRWTRKSGPRWLLLRGIADLRVKTHTANCGRFVAAAALYIQQRAAVVVVVASRF